MNTTPTPNPTDMLATLLAFPPVHAAVTAHDFGRAWTPGNTPAATLDGLRTARLIHRALQVAMTAAWGTTYTTAFQLGTLANTTPRETAQRAARCDRHRLLPRARGVEPTPHLQAQLDNARAMGWVRGKWVG